MAKYKWRKRRAKSSPNYYTYSGSATTVTFDESWRLGTAPTMTTTSHTDNYITLRPGSYEVSMDDMRVSVTTSGFSVNEDELRRLFSRGQ